MIVSGLQVLRRVVLSRAPDVSNTQSHTLEARSRANAKGTGHCAPSRSSDKQVTVLCAWTRARRRIDPGTQIHSTWRYTCKRISQAAHLVRAFPSPFRFPNHPCRRLYTAFYLKNFLRLDAFELARPLGGRRRTTRLPGRSAVARYEPEHDCVHSGPCWHRGGPAETARSTGAGRRQLAIASLGGEGICDAVFKVFRRDWGVILGDDATGRDRVAVTLPRARRRRRCSRRS
ncbi:hypothetical protein DFH11DRAFT_946389 [Phellopilus nigrolimitatus]|nr:hypothetical protein DFH11DRAFT_946389 [Phellopilus nigrolimitatus]